MGARADGGVRSDRAPSSDTIRRQVRTSVLVSYRAGIGSAAQISLEDRLGASRERTISDLRVILLTVKASARDGVISSLNRSPRVRFAEAERVYRAAGITPNDYWWPNEWSPVITNAPSAWDLTTGSPSVVVAVLDSGVDFTQPDLQGAFVAGRDVVNNDADPTDDYGHGTYVAGIIGARSNNGIGIASYCWSCSIMPVKVLGSDGSGSTSAVATGITWATDHGANVINMSLGSQSSSGTMASAVKYARDHGVVVVASAGNYGTSAPVYPAAYPEVIGVAGSDSTDHLYSWSSYGSWVSVAAPGINFATGRNGWYGTFAGTSSAAPVVAGIAGLVLAAHGSDSPADVERAIEDAVVPIGSVVAYGRVDAAAAVGANALTSPLPSPSPSLSPSSSPSPTATPPPSPDPSDSTVPPAGTTTVAFSGSLSKGRPSKTFAVDNGAGAVSAVLTFTKVASLTLDVTLSDGSTAGQATGGAPVTLVITSPAGTTRFTVSGADKGTFTLTVVYANA
jgi:subtilisin family serine protease